jgi:hypothetical protein
VGNHASEKDWVQPRKGASNKALADGNVQVAHVVRLSGMPTKDNKGKEDHGPTFLLAEAILLAVGRVPGPVGKEARDVE